jgi:hypothetical protein
LLQDQWVIEEIREEIKIPGILWEWKHNLP